MNDGRTRANHALSPSGLHGWLAGRAIGRDRGDPGGKKRATLHRRCPPILRETANQGNEREVKRVRVDRGAPKASNIRGSVYHEVLVIYWVVVDRELEWGDATVRGLTGVGKSYRKQRKYNNSHMIFPKINTPHKNRHT